MNKDIGEVISGDLLFHPDDVEGVSQFGYPNGRKNDSIPTLGRFTPRGRAKPPRGRLHEISAFFGLEAGLNYTLQ
jgi:hypothetical protein